MKPFTINFKSQSYGSVSYQLYITITFPNEDQNSNISNLFILLFCGQYVTENNFHNQHFFQLPGLFLLDWLSDKMFFLKANLKFKRYLLLKDHYRRKFWALSTYSSIIYYNIISHGLSASACITVRILSAIACFEHLKLSVRVNL